MEPLGEQFAQLRELYHGEEVRDVLFQLFGVTEEPFLRAMGHAWLEWAARSEFDAPSFPGTLLWGHTVRHERRELFDHGFPFDNSNNFATCFTPDGRMAIAVETGDRFTGTTIPQKRPRTNSMKGPRAMQMVQDNRMFLQGNLFTGFAQARPLRREAPVLWIHLIHQSRGDVVSEISLPTVSDKHNRIIGWRTRIVLPRWRGGSDPSGVRIQPPEPSADAEIRIARRIA
jgi:hypothetical protein